MKEDRPVECVIIGYNETPFEDYEALLRRYGEDSEAYRDLKFSFVSLDGRKMTYVDLLNYVSSRSHSPDGILSPGEFRSGDIPSLAAAYLTYYLRKRGFQARYVNLFQYEKAKLLDYLEQNPLCLAITTTLYVVNFPVNEIVKYVRQHNGRVKIVVGGPLIANLARNYTDEEFAAAVEDIGADIYVIEAQGEYTLGQIVASLKEDLPLASIPNIAYWEDGRLRRNPPVPEANSLDENYIDWRLISDGYPTSTVQTRTARSCAFNCSFCNYPTRAGKLTLAGLDTIEKELDSMQDLGVKNVVFIDDTFNVPLPRFKDACRLMIKRNYSFNWFSYFRCSNSDEEAFELMARSGCKGVFLGIESGSATILQNMHKAATVEKYLSGIDQLRRHGIMTFASFIIGFPGETDETVSETVDFIRAALPDYYRAQLWYCEPGTPIDRQREKYRISGEGFVWSHLSMDSSQAMDHIERMFLHVQESIWLPQWSFDFWIVPYLIGKGLTLAQFKEFMNTAQRLLELEIASVPKHERAILQQEYIRNMVAAATKWG
jgi:radical SAM PhpK family P-methyltransferase